MRDDDDDTEVGAKTLWRPLMDVLLLDILFLDDVINAVARTKARDASPPRRNDDDIIPIVDIVIIINVVLPLLFLFFLLFVW